MHAILFGMKRAFQRSLAVTRGPFARIRLTPARFDMLYAIDRGTTLQSDLRRQLGVTAPTVSRMLKSLEKLGILRRHRPEHDTRQRCIELTPEGKKDIRYARDLAIDSGAAQLVVDTLVAGSRWYRQSAFLAVCSLESLIRQVRYNAGDTATLFYPWHPDD
jgi:DNA-binding MarR family transcriptional regulator